MAGFTGFNCAPVAVDNPSSFHDLLQPDEGQAIKKAAQGGLFPYHDHSLLVIQE
jgi:hypothetical protein